MFKITQITCRTLIKNRCIIQSVTNYSWTIRNIHTAARKTNRLYTNYSIVKHVTFLRLSKTALALSILSWLGFTTDDEKKESELITTLKRAVLCTQKGEYQKAERILHIALRLAQQQQNEQGITYCYDLLANVALDQQELDKAEKLFVSVLQRLINDGMAQDNLKVIHISLKLARINQLKAELDKAELGYQWCLSQIKNKNQLNEDVLALYGVINDWYAQFLLDKGDVHNSMIHLHAAYESCEKLKGKNDEQSMLLLNDLGITSYRAGNLDNAQDYLKEAIKVGYHVEDQSHLGVVHANLGLILIEMGILNEADKYCKLAWNLGMKHNNKESMHQASYCFDQIKQNLGK